MNRAEPRFDRDLVYGKQGELLMENYLEWIAKGNGRVEVKNKRFVDLEFYVETECDKGRTGEYTPSGINVTTADMWAFVIAETGIALSLPTALLRQAIKHKSAREKSTPDGSCPTHGILVSIGAIMDCARRCPSCNGSGQGFLEAYDVVHKTEIDIHEPCRDCDGTGKRGFHS